MQKALQHRPQPGDEKLRVKFYKEQVLMGLKSEMEQRPVFEPFDFVSILVPGDIGNEVCRKATEQDKERFLPLWVQYEASLDQVAAGTALDAWTFLTDSNKHLLRYLGFTNVEQIAGASDQQLQKVGMGGFEMRTKAKAFLEAQTDSEAAQKYASLAEETARQLAEMRAEMQEMKAFAAEAPEVSDAPRRGRPPKVENVQNAA
jgi:hypothetical protein